MKIKTKRTRKLRKRRKGVHFSMKMCEFRSATWEMAAGLIIISLLKFRLDNTDLPR